MAVICSNSYNYKMSTRSSSAHNLTTQKKTNLKLQFDDKKKILKLLFLSVFWEGMKNPEPCTECLKRLAENLAWILWNRGLCSHWNKWKVISTNSAKRLYKIFTAKYILQNFLYGCLWSKAAAFETFFLVSL